MTILPFILLLFKSLY